jgi:hypothetical protein
MSDDQQDQDEPELSEPSVDELVAAARRKYGRGGAGLAAGMLGLEIAMGTRKKPDSVQVQESPTEPIDIDTDGFAVEVDAQTTVSAPALARRAPLTTRKRRQKR